MAEYAFRRSGRANGGLTIETAAYEQIMGALYYEMYVADETLRGAAMDAWLNGAFKRVSNDFGEWMDQRAVARPKELQHVYEWNSVGQSQQRLFKLNRTSAEAGAMKISYQFLPSRRVAPIHPRLQIPNPINGKVVKRSSIFRQKAKIIESGVPVVIRPKGSNWLALPVYKSQFRGRQNRRGMIDDYGIAFSRGPIIVREPGGALATGGFGRSFRAYFSTGLATKRLRASGYMDRPARVAKIAGQSIPTNVRRAGFHGGINHSALKRQAKLEVEQAAKIYD